MYKNSLPSKCQLILPGIQKTMVAKNLTEAFLEAQYFVKINNFWHTLKIGLPCPEIANAAQGNPWAIITAFNPAGVQIDDVENWRRHQQLDQDTTQYQRLDAYGTGDGWPKEFGFLLVNISDEDAALLAVKYGQAAFVYGDEVGVLRMTKIGGIKK